MCLINAGQRPLTKALIFTCAKIHCTLRVRIYVDDNSRSWSTTQFTERSPMRYQDPRWCYSTLKPKQIAAIFHMTFSNAFSLMKMYEFRLTCYYSLYLGVQLTIFIIGWDYGLASTRRQAIISTNDGYIIDAFICASRPQWANASKPEQNGRRWYFEMQFAELQFIFHSNFAEVCSIQLEIRLCWFK